MPLDSFYLFAEGDIEKFCRIDWGSIRQKIIQKFVQIVHVDVCARSITADSSLRIYSFLFMIMVLVMVLVLVTVDFPTDSPQDCPMDE